MCSRVTSLPADTVRYCYSEVSCFGNKITSLTNELMMSKAQCCDSVSGSSWGSGEFCEPCDAVVDVDVILPDGATRKQATLHNS